MRALTLLHDMLMTLVIAFLGALQLLLVFWPASGEMLRSFWQ